MLAFAVAALGVAALFMIEPEPRGNAEIAGWPFGPGARRRLVTLLLACLCAAVLDARVYTTFERLRFIVMRGALEASEGTVTVRLPDVSRLAGQPVAVVLRLALDESASRAVRIAIGGRALATVPLVSGREIRVDLDLPDGAALSVGDPVEIASDGDGWSLTSLEVANVHGFSRGLFEFMIVPAAVAPVKRVPVLLTVTLLALMLLLPGYPARAVRHGFCRVVHVGLAALVCAFLAAVVVAPWVSGFRILLAWHTLVLLLPVLYYPTLEVGFRKALPTMRTVLEALRPAGAAAGAYLLEALRSAGATVWARRIPVLYLASFLLFVVAIARFHDPETGFTRFIRFNAHRGDQLIPALRDVPLHTGSGGYDGQFYAQLAVDPLLLDPATVGALDTPSYRARRILFSGTAFLFGLGQPRWVVHAYAIQNALFWIVLALLLTRWFPARDFRSFCLWVGCLFGHGTVVSIVRALPDLPGLLLLGLTVLAVERGSNGRAAALVGLAGLAKESNLLWSTALCDPAGLRRYGWRDLCVGGLLVAGPLALWMSYLWGADATSGSVIGARNFAAPLTGYSMSWGETLSELREAPSRYTWFKLLALISLGTQAMVLVAVRAWTSAWWRVGIASCALMLVLGPAVWGGHPGAVTRVLLPMTVAFNAMLPLNRWFWPLFVLGNLTIPHGLMMLGVIDWPALLNTLNAG